MSSVPSGQNKKKKSSSFFTEWLEKLQQESWQLELLISGFALFGIYEAKSLFPALEHWNQNLPSGFLNFASDLVMSLLKVGWRIFFLNLLLHVILRTMWIGAIGLRYISSEIDYDALRYSEFFDDFIRRKTGSYDDFIERLEKFCSVLFSYTFLLFLFFLSLISFFIVMMLPVFIVASFGKIGEYQVLIGWWAISYGLIGLLVFIDFITLGVFRRMKGPFFGRYYSYIFRFFSGVTLTFLYRPLLYNFIDNKYTKRLFFFSFPYILILIVYGNLFTINSKSHFPTNYTTAGLGINDFYYEDLNTKNRLVRGEVAAAGDVLPLIRLDNYHVKSDYASLFVLMHRGDEYYLTDSLGIRPYKKTGLRFTLFGEKPIEDSIKTRKIDDTKELRSNLYKESIQHRNAMRGLDQESNEYKELAEKRNHISFTRDSLQSVLDAWVNDYNLKKKERVLKGLQSLISLKIDSTNYTDSLTCHYYIHPQNESKGILCVFPTKNIGKGEHNLYVKRRLFHRNQDTYYESPRDYVLPILKY